MEKELEALEIYLDKRIKDIKNYLEFNERSEDEKDFTPSKELQICYLAKRMLAIDNAKRSEALKCLNILGDFEWHKKSFKESFSDLFNTLELSIIKAQEQEKVLKILFEKRVDNT